MRGSFLPPVLLALWSCGADETVSGHAAGAWRLTALDGAPVEARMVLRFPAPGRVAGDAPCNAFSGAQRAPYPWIDVGPLAVTRRACPALAAEGAMLAALEAMTLAEVAGDVLILANDAGREMVFARAEAP